MKECCKGNGKSCGGDCDCHKFGVVDVRELTHRAMERHVIGRKGNFVVLHGMEGYGFSPHFSYHWTR